MKVEEQNISVKGMIVSATAKSKLEALDREWTRRADVATNQNRGVDAPHRKLDDSFKPKAQENEIQRSQAETSTQTEHTHANIDNESTGSESQQTAPLIVTGKQIGRAHV